MKIGLFTISFFLTAIAFQAYCQPSDNTSQTINSTSQYNDLQTYPEMDSQQYQTYLARQKEYYKEMNDLVNKEHLNPWGKKNVKIYNPTENTHDLSKRVRYNYENVYGKPVLDMNINHYRQLLKQQKAYWSKLDSMTTNDEKTPEILRLNEEKVNEDAKEVQLNLDQSRSLGI